MDRITILLAEDDCGHQDLLCRALTQNRPHVSVQIVTTGEQAIQRLVQTGPDAFDCIVLDYNLPGDDAADILPRLADVGWNRPTLIVSSSAEQQVVIRSMRCGGVDFVPKAEAIRDDNLWSRINLALEKWRRKESTRRRIARRAERLALLADQDPLSGLSNRRSLERVFRRNRSKYDRRGRVTVVMIDVDHFKRVNDTFGHDAGDQVLRCVGRIIRDRTEPDDFACRFGGEEFVILRPNTTLAEGLGWAERLRSDIQQLRFPSPYEALRVTASIGIVNCPSEELTPDAITRADQAMYAAKRLGRNRTCTWEMVVFQQTLQRVSTASDADPESRLRRLLELSRGWLGPVQREHLTSHSEKVSRLVVSLGRGQGLDAPALSQLRLAGLCHDLGKYLVPDDVLSKPASLSVDEQELLARHSEDGAVMSKALGVDDETAECIRYHHAWFNPRQAADLERGADIPLGARLLAVADAVVAMTSSRSYHALRSPIAALSELRRARGTQFDPGIVDAMTGAVAD